MSFGDIVKSAVRNLSSTTTNASEDKDVRKNNVIESIKAASRLMELKKILPSAREFAETFEGILDKDLIEDIQSNLDQIFSTDVQNIFIQHIYLSLTGFNV